MKAWLDGLAEAVAHRKARRWAPLAMTAQRLLDTMPRGAPAKGRAGLLVMLVTARAELGDREGALAAARAFRECKKAGDNDRLQVGIIMGQLDELPLSLDLISSMKRHTPLSEKLWAAAWYQVTLQDLQAGRSNQALRAARKLVERFPDDGEHHALLANALAIVNRPHEALEALERATNNPHTAALGRELHVQMAQMAQDEGRLQDALASTRAAIACVPDDSDIHYDLACYLALTGSADDAMAALTRSVELGWSDVAHIEQDEDFAILADRADFAALIARMKGA